MTSPKLEIVSVNVSEERGTAKQPAESVVLDARGVAGDSHAGLWHRQVSLLSEESITRFSERTGMSLGPGDFGENLTVRGLHCGGVGLLDRFAIGEAELEVTQIGKECHGQGCAIFQEVGECVMPDMGIFTRVIRGGPVRPGDPVVFHPKIWRFRVITLSDRAFHGEYEDRSGPRVRELIESFVETSQWRAEFEAVLLSDDPEAFREELQSAREAGVDVVFSTGGTGVSPRDLAPETVTAFCDRLVPGLPEALRAKYGATNPNAWLSRAVVGLAGTMAVYTLPGSVRAVEEYLEEIFVTLEHLLLMVHGIDAHSRPPAYPPQHDQ